MPTAPEIWPTATAVARPLQPLDVAGDLEAPDGELEPEGDRFGVDAVAAPDHDGVAMLERPLLQHAQQMPQVAAAGCRLARSQLQRQAGVEHVRRGHAVMDVLGGIRPRARRRW